MTALTAGLALQTLFQHIWPDVLPPCSKQQAQMEFCTGCRFRLMQKELKTQIGQFLPGFEPHHAQPCSPAPTWALPWIFSTELVGKTPLLCPENRIWGRHKTSLIKNTQNKEQFVHVLGSSHLVWVQKYLGTQHKWISWKKRAAAPLPALVPCKILFFSSSKLHIFLWTQLLGMSREFRRGTHALKIFYRQHFQLQAFFGGEKTPLELGSLEASPPL